MKSYRSLAVELHVHLQVSLSFSHVFLATKHPIQEKPRLYNKTHIKAQPLDQSMHDKPTEKKNIYPHTHLHKTILLAKFEAFSVENRNSGETVKNFRRM